MSQEGVRGLGEKRFSGQKESGMDTAAFSPLHPQRGKSQMSTANNTGLNYGLPEGMDVEGGFGGTFDYSAEPMQFTDSYAALTLEDFDSQNIQIRRVPRTAS